MTRSHCSAACRLVALERFRDSLTAIIHCAAELSFDPSADNYAVNCDVVWNMLEFVAACPKALYVHFSTAACCSA